MKVVVALLERVEHRCQGPEEKSVEMPKAVSGCHDLDVCNGQHRACYSIPPQWEVSYFEHCKVRVSRLLHLTFVLVYDGDIRSRRGSIHQNHCPIQRPLHRRMQAARPIRAWRALVRQSTPHSHFAVRMTCRRHASRQASVFVGDECACLIDDLYIRLPHRALIPANPCCCRSTSRLVRSLHDHSASFSLRLCL